MLPIELHHSDQNHIIYCVVLYWHCSKSVNVVSSSIFNTCYCTILLRAHIKCCPSIACLQFSVNRKATETSNLSETLHWTTGTELSKFEGKNQSSLRHL